jgi:hypothetical protein
MRSSAIMGTLILASCLPSGPAVGQDEPVWELVEELRVGAVDGPGSLTRIGQALFDPRDSSVYVTQPEEHRILLIDPSGRVRRTIGRRGSGPGEFSALGAIGLHGDTLYAIDDSQRRVSLFTRGGEHLTTFSVRGTSVPGFVPNPIPLALSGDGGVVATPLLLPDAVIAGRVAERPLLRLDRGGRLERELARSNVRGMFASFDFDDGITMYTRPLAGRTVSDVDAGGRRYLIVEQPPLSGDEGGFRVVVGTTAGDTVYDRRFSYRPIPVPASVTDSIYAAYAPAFAGPGGTPDQGERRARSAFPVPGTFPPVRRAILTEAGTVWLQLESPDPGAAYWTSLSGAGDVQGTLKTSASVQILSVYGSTVFAAEKDALDVPYLVRYSLRRRP